VAALKKAVNIKKTSLKQYQYIFKEHERLSAENSQLDAKLARLPPLDLRIPSVATAMRVISQEIPEDMALSTIEIKQAEGQEGLEMQLRGQVFGRKQEAFPMITRFMERLAEAPVFSQVQLGSAGDGEVSPPAVLAFQIGCRLK
jgi:hypothetical protein